MDVPLGSADVSDSGGGKSEARDLGSDAALARVLREAVRADESRPPDWRIHDRTHLELVVDYRIQGAADEQTYEWDAYFFVPDSLRLHDQTYQKNEIYDDLLSYVRLEVPGETVASLTGEPLVRLSAALSERSTKAAALRELRVFACIARSAFTSAERAMQQLVVSDVARAEQLVQRLGATAKTVTAALRVALAPAAARFDDEVREAARWVDEDVSRGAEGMLASLGIALRSAGRDASVVDAVAAIAADEARHRRDHGLDGVGRRDMSERDVEHLEFRRHLLKRFSSSALWLALDVRQAGVLARQLLFGLAASVAMAFALFAAFGAGGNPQDLFSASALAIIVAYALKDRIKAWLQAKLSTLVSRFFPDRDWRIFDDLRSVELARVHERSGFVAPSKVAPRALALRRANRLHQIEEEARPERVLWHHKTFTVHAKAMRAHDPRFPAVSEVFRLNVRKWLDHTDDPKRRILFADPEERQIYSATAKRVYNIGIVYRLARVGGADTPWRRVRVVVTRKGIVRVDPVADETPGPARG